MGEWFTHAQNLIDYYLSGFEKVYVNNFSEMKKLSTYEKI